TYSSTSATPSDGGTDDSRSIAFTVSDGTSAGTSTTDTVNIFALQASGAANSFTQGGAATTIDSGLTVSDPAFNLASATVTISSGFFAGDTLGFNTTGTVIGVVSNSGGVLKLSGSDTAAHYQQVLDSVTYSSSSNNPTDFQTDNSRGFTITGSDGTNSGTVSETVTITAVDQPPTLATTQTPPTYSAGGAAVTIDGTITASDPDNQSLA